MHVKSQDLSRDQITVNPFATNVSLVYRLKHQEIRKPEVF